MKIIALSRSRSFESHLAGAVRGAFEVSHARSEDDVRRLSGTGAAMVLVHARSFPGELDDIAQRLAATAGVAVGVAADVPRLEEMLRLTGNGVRAYFNAYMADTHYRHMLGLLGTGQSWFAPPLLAHALEVARQHLDSTSGDELECLTRRQQEIARDVSSGLSNRQIAGARGISERTVKTHLTHIFKKLGVANRHALGARLRQASQATASPSGKAS